MGEKRITKFVISALVLAALGTACTKEPGNHEVQQGLHTLTSLDDFTKETGSYVRISFEDLPLNADSCSFIPVHDFIPNPLVLEGVTFHADYCLETAVCTSPTCTPDPDNPDGINILLVIDVDSTIDFPEGTLGVMLVVEGLGDMPYKVLATDASGATSEASGRGVYYGTSYLGVSSPAGLSRLEVLEVGPTPSCPVSPCGPLALTEILVGPVH